MMRILFLLLISLNSFAQLAIDTGSLATPAITFIGYNSGIYYSSENNGVLKFSINGINAGHIGHAPTSNGTTIDGWGNTSIGQRSGISITTGAQNTIFGSTSGGDLTSGRANTFIGSRSGVKTTTAYYNTFVGQGAGFYNVIGQGNVYLGYHAGINLTPNDNVQGNTILGTQAGEGAINGTAYGNTIVGFMAGRNISSGYNNVFSGANAGGNNTIGSSNVSIGNYSGGANQQGIGSTNIGINSGGNNISTSTTHNVHIGYNAGLGGYNTYIGKSNTIVGSQSCRLITSANEVTTLGRESLYSVTTGNGNTAIGSLSGYNVTTGIDNVLIGRQAGYTAEPANTLVSGDKNTFIGVQSGQGSTTQLIGSTAIGYRALVTANNTVILGATTNQVGIGNTSVTPSAKFQVSSTTQGVLGVRMTSAQRTAISSPANGLEVYDLDFNAKMIYNSTLYIWTGFRFNGTNFQGYDGTNWIDLN